MQVRRPPAHVVVEVHPTAFLGWFQWCDVVGADPRMACAQLGLDRATLCKHGGAWSDYATLFDAIMDDLGGPEVLHREGAKLMDATSWLDPMIRALVDPHELFRFYAWLNNRLYAPMRMQVAPLAEGRLLLENTIDPAARGCTGFLAASVGAWTAGTRRLGLPDTEVAHDYDSHHGTFVITPPPAASLRHQATHWLDGKVQRFLTLFFGERPSSPEPDASERLERHADAWGLTPAETRVLRKLVDGRTNKQIANALGIAPGTVAIHVGQILDKSGCEGRGVVIARFWRTHPQPATP